MFNAAGLQKGAEDFLYQKRFKIFFAGTAAAALLRTLLKTLYVDIETGFYLGGTVLVYGFATVVSLTVALLAIGVLKQADATTRSVRGNRLLETSALIFGVTVAVSCVPKLMTALAIDPAEPAINRLPRWMLIFENVLGVASGLVLLYLAFCLFSGARRSGTHGMLALLAVAWQTISMVERFISFRQVNTVSDQFLETMYLICATLFLLANTRCMAGMAKNTKVCALWGLLAAHFGLVLTAGQISAVLVLGEGVSGPSIPQMAIMTSLSLYALAASWSLDWAPKSE